MTDIDLSKVCLEAAAVKSSGYPKGDIPEAAFAGRSNVGKSSVINMLLGRKKLAYVGKTPGKTRTVNFYNIDGKLRFVDLPGYGYAVGTRGREKDWAGFVNDYLTQRKQLKIVAHLIDARHKPTELDIRMNGWLNASGIRYIICLTKTDKLSRLMLQNAFRTVIDTLVIPGDVFLLQTSALHKKGRGELLEYILTHVLCDNDISSGI